MSDVGGLANRYYEFCGSCTCCHERVTEHQHCVYDVRTFHAGESHAAKAHHSSSTSDSG